MGRPGERRDDSAHSQRPAGKHRYRAAGGHRVGNTAADIFERGGPYFVRAAEDLLPTTKLLDDYRAMIFCTIRNYAEVGPRFARVLGGDNGYALKSYGTILLPGNPFVYPDNLPQVNAHGGPELVPAVGRR